MAELALSNRVLETDDGIPLKTKLARANRRQRIRAFLLVAPLLIFIFFTFIWPIAMMLLRSVNSAEFGQVMHRTSEALDQWDGRDLPPEETWRALVEDLKEARQNQTIGKAATVINFERPAARSLFTRGARNADKITEGPYREALLNIDKGWEDPTLWALMKRLSAPYTARFFLNAVDLQYDDTGAIAQQDELRQIYVQLFARTAWMSALVTIMCLLLGYPVAYLLSVLPLRTSNLLMIFVLLPFWTSLLVRTTAWIALLQTNGVINDVLVWIGVMSDEYRIQMIFNATGTVIAMTHILLPFMILPLYSVMKTIPPSYMRAARSLGADQFTAFTRVYMPQTLPGVGAGCILVFILAIGYYITPALVGGESGTMISNMIAYHMQKSLNWSLAAALATLLLGGVLVLYWLYNRVVGVDNMKLG
jgi:putative spermidine/putrescine transport system permease protein